MSISLQNLISTGKWAKMMSKLNEYLFPEESGTFIGTLEHKTYKSDRKCLMCYFRTDDSRKIVLPIWEDSKTSKYTTQNNKETCFLNDVQEGSRWKCEYEVVKDKGYTRFLNAIMITKSKVEVDNNYYIKSFFLMLIKRAFPRQLIANIEFVRLNATSEKELCALKDNRITYRIYRQGNDYCIYRDRYGETKEKTAKVLVDGASFDVISKLFV